MILSGDDKHQYEIQCPITIIGSTDDRPTWVTINSTHDEKELHGLVNNAKLNYPHVLIRVISVNDPADVVPLTE